MERQRLFQDEQVAEMSSGRRRWKLVLLKRGEERERERG